jgi:hypothetical protein
VCKQWDIHCVPADELFPFESAEAGESAIHIDDAASLHCNYGHRIGGCMKDLIKPVFILLQGIFEQVAFSPVDL